MSIVIDFHCSTSLQTGIYMLLARIRHDVLHTLPTNPGHTIDLHKLTTHEFLHVSAVSVALIEASKRLHVSLWCVEVCTWGLYTSRFVKKWPGLYYKLQIIVTWSKYRASKCISIPSCVLFVANVASNVFRMLIILGMMLWSGVWSLKQRNIVYLNRVVIEKCHLVTNLLSTKNAFLPCSKRCTQAENVHMLVLLGQAIINKQ